MRRGDWSGLDYRCKSRALLVIEDRGPARRLARRQTIGTAFVEPQDPVAHDLTRDAGQLRRFAPAPTIQDHTHRTKPPDLIPSIHSPRQLTQPRPSPLPPNP